MTHTHTGVAENGHLHCLMYAHKHGCPWCKYTCIRAAHNAHLGCLKYTRSSIHFQPKSLLVYGTLHSIITTFDGQSSQLFSSFSRLWLRLWGWL